MRSFVGDAAELSGSGLSMCRLEVLGACSFCELRSCASALPSALHVHLLSALDRIPKSYLQCQAGIKGFET